FIFVPIAVAFAAAMIVRLPRWIGILVIFLAGAEQLLVVWYGIVRSQWRITEPHSSTSVARASGIALAQFILLALATGITRLPRENEDTNVRALTPAASKPT